MNGIHDVGGMDGFGPVDTTEAEETFHEEWEGVVYSVQLAGLGHGLYTVDEFRHSIERMPPRDYLAASYYDRWVTGITRLLVEGGVVDPEEFAARTRSFEAGEAEVPERTDPALLGEIVAGVKAADDADAADADDADGADGVHREPRFDVGDGVNVRNVHPAGHTRCPRYARRARGVIQSFRGTYTLPDASAHGEERAEPLYNVQFDADELWSDRADGESGGNRADVGTGGNTTVALDLWGSYLRPADGG